MLSIEQLVEANVCFRKWLKWCCIWPIVLLCKSKLNWKYCFRLYFCRFFLILNWFNKTVIKVKRRMLEVGILSYKAIFLFCRFNLKKPVRCLEQIRVGLTDCWAKWEVAAEWRQLIEPFFFIALAVILEQIL